MFRIKVNATTANLCVGFDVLGMALSLENIFVFIESDSFEFDGFEPQYCSCQTNLVYKSYEYVFKKINKELIPLKIVFKGNIPICRGLGSSSSLIVAGVFAANYVLNNYFTEDELFDICVELEGHPDNVAPAIMGGFVSSYKTLNGYKSISYPVSNELKFITVIPKYELSTHEARGVLPKTLTYSNVVNNMSRIIHLPKALELGDLELIEELFIDELHEPYRSKLIKEYDYIYKLCKEEKLPFCISGSGSTMLIIAKDDKIVNKLNNLDCDIKVLELGSKIKIEENIYE